MNLVVNARDAMPDGGTLTIETANVELDSAAAGARVAPGVVEPGAYVELLVTDTGVGMDEATQARMFEPFFTTKERGAGTGLGLSTVYGIVKQSGGYVWVDSKPAKGAAFHIYLPGAAAGSREPERTGPRAASRRGSETVLVVEDDQLVRTSARRVLTKNGYRVLEAANGAEALRICRTAKAPIDLILSDLVMPELGGRELVCRLRESDPRARVLFMSGYTEEAAQQRNVLQPGDAFLAKPFTPEALTRKVREVLDGHPAASAPEGAYPPPGVAKGAKPGTI
jgi:CheY-like chemotaxis protein